MERLLNWYLYTADAAYSHITPHRRRVPLEPRPSSCGPLTFTTYEQALEWCTTERANLVTAVHTAASSGHPGIAWRLPATLWGFFYLRSHTQDWADTTRTGLTAAQDARDRRGEAEGHLDLAAALRMSGRRDEAIDHLHQSLTVYQELGDMLGRAIAVTNLGDAYKESGRLEQAAENVSRSLAIFRRLGNTWSEGIALSNLGDIYQRLDRFNEAGAYLEQALTVLRASGNRWVEGVTVDILGTVQHRLGRHDGAEKTYRSAQQAHHDAGNRWGGGHGLGLLGNTYLASGQPRAARANLRLALAILEGLDHPEAAEIQEKIACLDGQWHSPRAHS
ncbi:tetratricopeptide (TPR) repeat protein [Streptomyces aurantiacus]|uniref:tetratricopeptide repeat protein n=1 Tax=Streptomyces aurantiacus TaxID=47760 RepID=UPI002793B8D4|nr:tetratricopeptide repeat protein [Streptomyces aurantiacus]MDQ0771635.1 tetratricopeptide (TPR) repeat protein [Streptomyces aurantiacus]